MSEESSSDFFISLNCDCCFVCLFLPSGMAYNFFFICFALLEARHVV